MVDEGKPFPYNVLEGDSTHDRETNEKDIRLPDRQIETKEENGLDERDQIQ